MTRGPLVKRSSGDAHRPGSPLTDPHYTIPLYRKAEAAHIIRVPPSTLRNWAGGPAFSPDIASTGTERLRNGHVAEADDAALPARLVPREASLITVAEAPTPRGPTIPFVGLTEAYILASFRQAGVPMQRIRPAIRRLEEEMGLTQALASERLRADGAELLWDYGQQTHDQAQRDVVGDLVVVRDGHSS
jgi:hypothetical protein